MLHCLACPDKVVCAFNSECDVEEGRHDIGDFRPNTGPTPTNPKDVAALKDGKSPLEFLEPAADEVIARALAAGAAKYGRQNYLTAPILVRTYVGAIRRHVAAWLNGQDEDPDTGLHHLAHIGANVHVALAALAAGSAVDDRPAPPPPKELAKGEVPRATCTEERATLASW